MTKSKALARIALAALCTLTAVTGFGAAAQADDPESTLDHTEQGSNPSGERPWTVHSECWDGFGVAWATYEGPSGTSHSGYERFECTGTWAASINFRVGSQPELTYEGTVPVAQALAQVPGQIGQPSNAGSRFVLSVDCSSGATGTATLYFQAQGENGPGTAIQSNPVSCYGVRFTWMIVF